MGNYYGRLSRKSYFITKNEELKNSMALNRKILTSLTEIR
jgi:hypothetical protein